MNLGRAARRATMVLNLYGWTGWRLAVGRPAGPRYPAAYQPRV